MQYMYHAVCAALCMQTTIVCMELEQTVSKKPTRDMTILDPTKIEAHKSKRQKLAELQLIARCMAELPAEIGCMVREYFFDNNPDLYLKELVQSIPVASKKLSKWHQAPIFSIAFNNDGTKIASADKDGVVTIWDAQEGAYIKRFTRHSGKQIACIQFMPGSSVDLVFGGRHKTIIKRTINGGPHKNIVPFDDSILTFDVNKKDVSHKVVGGVDGRVVMFTEVGNNEEIKDQFYFPTQIHCVTYNHNGSKIAVLPCDNYFHIYDCVQKKMSKAIEVPDKDENLWTADFSPDDSYLAMVNTSGYLYVYDVETLELVFQVQTARSRATGCKWISDRYIATVSAGRGDLDAKTTLKIWDFKERRLFRHVDPSALGKIWALDVSPDGTKIACGGSDKTVSVYDLSGLYSILSRLSKPDLSQALMLFACLRKGDAACKCLYAADNNGQLVVDDAVRPTLDSMPQVVKDFLLVKGRSGVETKAARSTKITWQRVPFQKVLTVRKGSGKKGE